MGVLFTIGLLAAGVYLTASFAYIEQRLLNNDKICADAMLWKLCSFVVFAICLMLYFIIYN